MRRKYTVETSDENTAELYTFVLEFTTRRVTFVSYRRYRIEGGQHESETFEHWDQYDLEERSTVARPEVTDEIVNALQTLILQSITFDVHP